MFLWLLILECFFIFILSVILYFIPVPIFISLTNGRIIFRNKAFLIWSKYSLPIFSNIIHKSKWHPSGYIELENGARGFLRLLDIYLLKIITILNPPPIKYVVIDYNGFIIESLWPFRAKGNCFYNYISDPNKLKEGMTSIREYVFTTYLDGIRSTIGVTRVSNGFIVKDLSSSFWRHNHLMHDLRDLFSGLLINSSQEIASHLERASILINNLLNQSDNFTKAQWVKIAPYKALIQIGDIMKSTLRSIEYKIIGRTDKYVKMPPASFERIILNLLNNAREAMQNNGNVAIYLTETVNDVIISIEDDGPGISKENRIKIFENGISTKGQFKGSGLAIVSDLLKAASGSIECVDSNKGAKFIIKIPIFTKNTLSGKKILLVEDNIKISNGLSKELKKHNAIVTIENTFSGSIARLKKNKFDIIISDAHLEGKAAGSALKEKCKNTQFLLISGDIDCINQHRQAGINCLLKPFNMQTFINCLCTIVD